MNDKVVLITGASSGMGRETALQLAKDGYKVYGAARRKEKLTGLEGVAAIEMDISNEDSIVSGVQEILERAGHIDILINNAGYGEYGPIENIPLKDARYQLEVNLFGAARLIQLVLPKMRANKWGKIFNITSIGGKLALPFGGWYHASKFAMEGLSDALRNEVRPFGIDVIVIEPGAIETEWGGIAVNNMMKYAEGTEYAEIINKMKNGLEGAINEASEPAVIADAIRDILKEAKPKARYNVGAHSDEMLAARKNMTDEEFDLAMAKIMLGD